MIFNFITKIRAAFLQTFYTTSIQKNLNAVGANYLQNIDYQYNSQGWLTGINTLCVNAAAAAASAPPASVTTINVTISTVPDQWAGSSTVATAWFGLDVSANLKVDGVPQTVTTSFLFQANAPGSDSAAWNKVASLPAGVNLTQQTPVDLSGLSISYDGALATFFQSVEQQAKTALSAQGFAAEKTAPILTALQSVVEQVIQPVSVAAAAPAIAAALASQNSSDLFAMGIYYEIPNTALSALAQKSGNISHLWWQVNCDNPQYYGFQYDFLDRLTTATSATYDFGTSAYINANRYNETQSYDLRGNINSITRKGSLGANTFGNIDVLAYTYVSNNKNRIATIAETGNFTRGFKTTVTGAATYGFDLNGNMARDPHKKMTTNYFYHNLPKKVTFDNGNIIEWVYDATGNKLTKKTNAATNNVTHYINGIEYVGTVASYNIEAIYHTEGRCTPQSSTWRYEYSLRDHLGNTRITFTDLNSDGTITASEILQQNHYYPFGGNIEGLTSAGTPNKYQYNGKEWNADFGLEWNDYGARAYDPWVGRWWSVDPMAEKYCRWSSYNYGVDNPVRFIDPDGKSATDYVYLNMQGKEIGRLKSNKVQRVTIIKDENVGAFQALPRSYSSVSKYQSLGISYDTKSINQLYLESENDKRGHLYGAYYINSKDAKPRTDISIEHGATLKLVKGVATVNRKTIGLPTEVSPEGLTETGEVANVHTHPNEDKGTTGFSRLPGIFDFDDNGPSSRDNNPYNMRQGYLKVVVDKDNIYFFNKTGTVASLSRKKL